MSEKHTGKLLFALLIAIAFLGLGAFPKCALAEDESYISAGGSVHLNLYQSTGPWINTDSTQGSFTLHLDPDLGYMFMYGDFSGFNPPLPQGSNRLRVRLSANFYPFPPSESQMNFFDPQTGAFGVPYMSGQIEHDGQVNSINVPSGGHSFRNNGLVGIVGEGSTRLGDYGVELIFSGAFRFEGTHALETCQSENNSLTADADGDSVYDSVDQCEGSAAPVDYTGCDRTQFCGMQSDSGRCKRADWKNDQPLGATDCEWNSKIKRCVGHK